MKCASCGNESLFQEKKDQPTGATLVVRCFNCGNTQEVQSQQWDAYFRQMQDNALSMALGKVFSDKIKERLDTLERALKKWESLSETEKSAINNQAQPGFCDAQLFADESASPFDKRFMDASDAQRLLAIRQQWADLMRSDAALVVQRLESRAATLSSCSDSEKRSLLKDVRRAQREKKQYLAEAQTKALLHIQTTVTALIPRQWWQFWR